MDYDVFISCKSEDYKYAEEVYDFLKSEGVNVFLASRELRQMGEDEYMEAISEALESTTHFIVFSSVPEYLNAKWVKTEWKTFLNEVNSGRKVGKLVTLLKDISVGQIPILLRQYESLSFDDYQNCIIKYVETPAFLARKEEEKKRAQELADAKKKKEEEEKKKEKAKQELKELAKEYSTQVSALSTCVKEIEAKMRFIGISHRVCPICHSQVELSFAHCHTCGWSISPVIGIAGAEYLLCENKDQINMAKTIWDKVDNAIDPLILGELKENFNKERKEWEKEKREMILKALKNVLPETIDFSLGGDKKIKFKLNNEKNKYIFPWVEDKENIVLKKRASLFGLKDAYSKVIEKLKVTIDENINSLAKTENIDIEILEDSYVINIKYHYNDRNSIYFIDKYLSW